MNPENKNTPELPHKEIREKLDYLKLYIPNMCTAAQCQPRKEPAAVASTLTFWRLNVF
jgi:hypothetical protein